MKRFYLLLAAVTLLAAIAGCQKEPVGNENAESAKAYAELTISFANEGTSKAPSADDSESYDNSNADEYAVKSAVLYFVSDADDKVASVHKVQGNFTEKKVGNDVYYTSEIQNLKVGTYRVYAAINTVLSDDSNMLNVAVGAAESALIELLTTSDIPGASVPSTGIPMTSRQVSAVYNSNKSVLCDEVEITSNNTKDNPCPISLEMERSWAKISYNVKNLNNTYAVKDNRNKGSNKIADIQLTGYQILNQTKKWNAFRQACSVDNSYAVTKNGYGLFNNGAILGYLYDPEINLKTVADVKAALPAYTLVDGASANITSTSVGATQTLAYTYENALYKDAQLAGYVTTVRFTATITPVSVSKTKTENAGITTEVESVTTGYTDLYFYEDKFYADLGALNFVEKLGVTESNYADFNVKKFVSGVCYYDYYIKHFDNGKNPTTVPTPESEALLGVMEYAIVRNNSYVITVSEILAPGNDVANEVDANTPVEQTTTYFQVKLTIRPWVVRAQDAILG